MASPPALAASPRPVDAPLLPPPPPSARLALPDATVLKSLPGHGDLLALTVDDGVNGDVVRQYTQFAKDTGIRLTFFVNGTYRSWTDNRHCCGRWWSPARSSSATTPGRIRT